MNIFNRTRHRALFNIDCNVWMYQYRRQSAFYRPPGEPLTARHIHRYVQTIAEGGIDTLIVHAHTAQLAWYPSKTVPTVFDGYTRGDRSFFYAHILGWEMTPEQIETYLDRTVHMMDSYLDLAESGVDWLAETAKACRECSITPWVAIRMNDTHGATRYPAGSYMNGELYKDPAMRLRGTGCNRQEPPALELQGLDYDQPQVREYIFSAIRDLVENYDYDGLQLEWNRSPLCCEPDAAPETIELITDWHEQIRALTRRQAAHQGKYYALGLRHVGTLDQMKSIGLDIRAMAKRGTLDFVTPSNFWQSSWDIPCDEWKRELGPDVAVYGAIEIAPNWLHGYLPEQTQGNTSLGKAEAVNYRLTPYSPPLLHGNAAAKFALGVDGVEVYNMPCADQPSHWPWPDEPGCAEYSALGALSNLDQLRNREKFYTLSSQTGYYTHPPFESPANFPCILGSQEQRACRIPMMAEAQENIHELVLQLVTQNRADLPPLGVSFNGAWPRFDGVRDERLLFPVATMTHHAPDQVGLNFVFPLHSIREGWNEIVVMNGASGDTRDAATIFSLELAVRRKGL
jgi:hypothetical protein